METIRAKWTELEIAGALTKEAVEELHKQALSILLREGKITLAETESYTDNGLVRRTTVPVRNEKKFDAELATMMRKQGLALVKETNNQKNDQSSDASKKLELDSEEKKQQIACEVLEAHTEKYRQLIRQKKAYHPPPSPPQSPVHIHPDRIAVRTVAAVAPICNDYEKQYAHFFKDLGQVKRNQASSISCNSVNNSASVDASTSVRAEVRAVNPHNIVTWKEKNAARIAEPQKPMSSIPILDREDYIEEEPAAEDAKHVVADEKIAKGWKVVEDKEDWEFV
ncbi:MAG: hypothetical protein M1827_006255 [Pycnora praestabilis]|nr:MAG: hypothetical protein M1827_006255 [Pycnora praestabilis]